MDSNLRAENRMLKEQLEIIVNENKQLKENWTKRTKSYNKVVLKNADLEQENKQLEEKIEKLKTKIKTIKRNTKRDKAKLRNRINKAIEYNKSILKEKWYGGNEKKYAKKNLEILGDKENE